MSTSARLSQAAAGLALLLASEAKANNIIVPPNCTYREDANGNLVVECPPPVTGGPTSSSSEAAANAAAQAAAQAAADARAQQEQRQLQRQQQGQEQSQDNDQTNNQRQRLENNIDASDRSVHEYEGAAATNVPDAAEHFALKACVPSKSAGITLGSTTGFYAGISFNSTPGGGVVLSATGKDGVTHDLTIPELADTKSSKRRPFLAPLPVAGQELAMCLAGHFQAAERRLTRAFEHAERLEAQKNAAANARIDATAVGNAMNTTVTQTCANSAKDCANVAEALLGKYGINVELSGTRDAPVAPPALKQAPAAPRRAAAPAATAPATCVPKPAVPAVPAVTCD